VHRHGGENTTYVNLRLMLAISLLAASASGLRAEGPTAGWHVVAYDHRITEADLAALEATGARAIQYLPEDSYVTWLGGAALEAAAPLGPRPLAPAEKVAPATDPRRLLDVTVYGGRAAGALPGAIAAHAVAPDRSLVSVTMRRVDVEALSRRPEVLSIGPAATGIEPLDEGTSQIVAGNIEGSSPVPGYRAFLDALGLGGAGARIAIADSGIDDTHPDLMGRVVARTDFTPLPDYRDSDGHGTHVAGIAAGSGAGVPGATDPSGFAYGMGVAPDAELVDVGVLGIIEEIVGIDDFPPFEDASAFAVRNGAVGWNASWGSGEGDRAGYTQTARTMDIITRDADWETPGAQPFTLVFAAGNSGNAGPGAPTEAKNLIAVASSRSHRAGNINTISSFSSKGPTLDGRIGPTIAAPGETVVSTRSITGSVLCNQPPVADGVPQAALYGVCSGTSMAAPHVTGALALITQWWRSRSEGETQSAAMTKALLVNSATDMGAPNVPNGSEGWGRVTLRNLFDPTAERILLDQDLVLEEASDHHEVRIEPADPDRPLKATLAWSDAAATPNAIPALVNDLDLTVTADDGTTYLGNNFAAGWSVPGGEPDRLEVLENVFVREPSGGYTLRISAANLPGDGVSFSGDSTDQDFALVVTNAVLVQP